MRGKSSLTRKNNFMNYPIIGADLGVKSFKDEIFDFPYLDHEEFNERVDRLKGLKNENESEYKGFMDEKLAAQLLFNWYQLNKDHVKEYGRKHLLRFRRDLKELGIDHISPDVLWDVCCKYEQSGYRNEFVDKLIDSNFINLSEMYDYWLAFKIWKDVFGEKLVFRLKRDECIPDITRESEAFLNAVTGTNGFDEYLIRDSEIKRTYFIDLVDKVIWPDDCIVTGHRVNRGVQVFNRGDAELMMMCFEKNIIPAEDVSRIFEEVKDKERNLISLLILRKHGYISDCNIEDFKED